MSKEHNEILRLTRQVIKMREALVESEKYVRCHVTQKMPKGGVLVGTTMLGLIERALKYKGNDEAAS
jgi:hypothetical protein